MSYEDADFVTYTHPSGIFSIDLPETWGVRDDSKAGYVIVTFLSPDSTILVRVAISNPPDDDSDEAYAALLQQFVEGTSGNEAAFSAEEPDYDDESIGIAYGYEINGTAFAADAYIWYEEPYAVMFAASMPDDQYDDLGDLIEEIGDSLAVDPDVTLP